MDYLIALAHIVILAIVVTALVSVVILRRTKGLPNAYIYVEIFLIAMLTASILDMPLYNNYAFFNIKFDKILFEVVWHVLCIAYSFLWLVVVSRFLSGIRGKIVKKINSALIIAYVTSGIILITCIPDMHSKILYAFNSVVTMLLFLCTAFGFIEINTKEHKKTFTIPMTLVSFILAIEGIIEMIYPNSSELVSTMYALVWAFASICILIAIMKENANISNLGSNKKVSLSEDNVIALIKEEYGLTDREMEIIRLINKGMSNSEIADELFIGGATVKTHIHNILTKMELSKKTDIIVLVKERMQK